MSVRLEGRPDVAPPRSPAPYVPPAPFKPRLSTPFLLLAAFAIFAATAVGWGLRAAITPAPQVPPPLPRTADLGPVTLAVAGAWAPERLARADLPGLDERATAAFAPVPGLRVHAVVTLAPIDDPSLVPAALRAAVTTPLGEPKRSELLGAPAWRYTELPLRGDRLMEVTVAPTTAGVLAVACTAPGDSWTAAAGCAAGLDRVSFEGAGWLRPARDLAVRARLPGVVERLDRRRAPLRAKLGRTTTRGGQSRLAGRLGRVYERAAGALAAGTRPSGPTGRVIAALRRSAASHRRLSAAAASGRPTRHRQSRRAVKRGDAALKRALSALR